MNETIIKAETIDTLIRTREKEGVANGPTAALADAVLSLNTHLAAAGGAKGDPAAAKRLAKIEDVLSSLDVPNASAIDEVVDELSKQIASKDEAIADLAGRLATLEEALGETQPKRKRG